MICLTGCRRGPLAAPLLQGKPDQAHAAACHLLDLFGRDHLFIELQHHYLPDDDWLIRQLLAFAEQHHLLPIATNNVHYAERTGSRLRDALVAIDDNTTLTTARRAGRLFLNDSYALASPAEMQRRFRQLPAALHNTLAVAERCQVSLDFSHHRLPRFPVPDGLSEFAYLYQLCHENLPKRYPDLKPTVLKQLAHELEVIDKAGLAGYFLIVWDIVHYARDHHIRCQGRGSAANSIVAYLLYITNVDPIRHNLLFERFLSSDRFTMPDIDIDFAADAPRESVIQYVYDRYGHAHAAMVCNIVTFQARSAVRELAKVLDFPQPVIDRLAKQLDTHSPTTAADQLLNHLSTEDPPSPLHPSTPSPVHPLTLFADLLRQIDGCPRHLSIHSGGMLITGSPLAEVVPLEPATMPGRIIAQWDKDSAEDAGLIKLDLLGLRMLGLLSEALDTIRQTGRQPPDLDNLSLDDPAIYDLLRRGDTIGAFQVESRAQQQMAPRHKPVCFEDIIVQIAIIRPGPIQGGAVHPYLRRRNGLEPVTFPHDCLIPVLAETHGTLLYQEQAIRVAVAAAGFTPGEADLLRRALSRSRPLHELQAMQERFLDGADQQGIDQSTAKTIWQLLAGFAGYGFPKSHSASFALIAYQSLWLKHYHPAAFYCALLNQQPMGFYSPEVILGDARRHGVDLLPPDIHRSDWHYTLAAPELVPAPEPVEGVEGIRTGLSTVKHLGAQRWPLIAQARQQQPFTTLPDFCRRTLLPRDAVTSLIRAGAFDTFGERRQLLWQLGETTYTPTEFDLTAEPIPTELPELPPLEQTAWEYELLGLSTGPHVIEHYRPALQQAGILTTTQVKATRPGQRIRVAGLVVIRQRPQTAKGILFISLEDEHGLLDLVVKPNVVTQSKKWPLRPDYGFNDMGLVVAEGNVQRNAGAVSVLVTRIHPLIF